MYIGLEGINCSGKTTQLDMLHDENHAIYKMREPDKLRNCLLDGEWASDIARTTAFMADRIETHAKLNKCAPRVAVSSRTVASGYAYSFMEYDTFKHTYDTLLEHITPCDHVIVYNMERSILAERLKHRANTHRTLHNIEQMYIEKHIKAQARILEWLHMEDIPHSVLYNNTIANLHEQTKDIIHATLGD